VLSYTDFSSTTIRLLTKDIPNPDSEVRTERPKMLKMLEELGEEL